MVQQEQGWVAGLSSGWVTHETGFQGRAVWDRRLSTLATYLITRFYPSLVKIASCIQPVSASSNEAPSQQPLQGVSRMRWLPLSGLALLPIVTNLIPWISWDGELRVSRD